MKILISTKVFPYLIIIPLSFLAVIGLPYLDKALHPDSTMPGLITLEGTTLVLIALTGILLYFGVTSKLTTIKKFLLFALLYNVLIIAVKFSLAPYAVYTYNLTNDIPFRMDDPFVIFLMGAVVMLAYSLVFLICSNVYKTSAQIAISGKQHISRKIKVSIVAVAITLLLGLLFSVTGSMFLAIIFVPLYISGVLTYVSVLLATPTGLLIAIALIGALLFLNQVFATIAEQARVVKSVTIISLFVAFGLGFLLLYHALWVVFMLVIVSIWPLRIVIPK